MTEFRDWEPAKEYEVGDKVTTYEPINTRWNRFLYWLIRRPIPRKKAVHVVTAVSGPENWDLCDSWVKSMSDQNNNH